MFWIIDFILNLFSQR